MMKIFRLLLFLAVAWITPLLHAETPAEGVDRVWNSWSASTGPRAYFSNASLCKAVAKEHGVAVLAPIMKRAKAWESEEGLIFVPLVAFLPREKTVSILTHYKTNGQPWEQQAATDFLIELNMSDVKETVKKMSEK